MTTVFVKCQPDQEFANQIRGLLCASARGEYMGQNPLTETNFNELLQKITQAAFDEGIRFERSKPGVAQQ